MFKVALICKNKEVLERIRNSGEQIAEFFTIDEINSLKNFELCILEADFGDVDYYEKVRKIINKNAGTTFWAGNFCCTKNDIIKAYSIGCKNFIRFPVTREELSNAGKFATESEKAQDESCYFNENFEEMRVLVVDDTEINLELLKEVLSVFNLQVVAFSDAPEAFEYTKKESTDLILLDVMMPELDGFEFAKKIKTTKNKNVPIVFISALSGNENKRKGYNLGSCAYIEKPFDISTIRARLFNILKIQKLQKQREDFIATLTHDLKTPVRAQIRALEMLLENKFGKVQEEQREMLSEILSSCKFLQYLTEDILINYKFENGSVKIRKERYSLKKLIEEKLRSFRYLLEQKKQTVRFSYNSDIEELEIDIIELGRVLDNLIINASEYSAEGKEIIIEVFSDDEENSVKVAIKNEGKRLSAKEADAVFERYYSKAREYNKIGAGLGLYISKKIVELHGGKIDIDLNSDSEYTTFVFSVPYKITGIKTLNTI